MSLFDGQDLFGSGPHRFQIGGLSLRHVLQEVPGGQGVQLSGLGRHGRSILQSGHLVADDSKRMCELTAAIESKLDGLAHELVDDQGRSWPNTVMIRFDPGPEERVGMRWHRAYRVEYLQIAVGV